MKKNEMNFIDFSLRLDRIIDGMRQNVRFVQKNKSPMKIGFYEGVLYAYKNIKTITKELRSR